MYHGSTAADRHIYLTGNADDIGGYGRNAGAEYREAQALNSKGNR